MRHTLFLSLALAVLSANAPNTTHAQDGSFIEGLFRTIAGAKAAKEREQEAIRQRETQRQREQAGNPAPQNVPVPSSFFPPGPGGQPPRLQPNKIPPRGQNAPTRQVNPPRRDAPPQRDPRQSGQRSIRVQSQAAADFVNGLVGFTTSADAMVDAMRATPNASPQLRAQLPEAYRIVADCQSLLDRCDGLADVSSLRDEYSAIDARWRKLSFDLRAIDSLDGAIRDPLRQCDRTCSVMAKQLRIEPQFDRRALRDVLITAASHMQTLEDDLTLCALPKNRVDGLTSSSRLLRQRLVREAERVDQASYEEAVTRFTDFLGRFGDFAGQVRTIDNPHVQARLDRIAQCGTDTYALLWMTPPEPAIEMTHQSEHLLRSVDELLNTLNFSTLMRLPREQQNEIFDLGRDLRAGAEHFHQEAGKGLSRSQLATCFAESDGPWSVLQPKLTSLGTIPRAAIAAVNRDMTQIGQSLGGVSSGGSQANLRELIESAAALEGSSEYLEADLKRYEHYLQPAAYRSTMIRAASDFHLESKRLHEQLSRGDDIRKLQQRTDRMINAWRQLTDGISDIDQHGLSPSRASRLQRTHQEILPSVARVAAALSSR